MLSHCSTIIIEDFKIDILTKTNQSTLQAFMNKHNFKLIFYENTTIDVTHKLITYGQMHQYNNVIMEQHKHIGKIINPFVLLLNYLFMFPNLYYHTILQNDLISCYIFLTLLHMCKHINAYTHIHIQINAYV
jgi:hypothetical protein